MTRAERAAETVRKEKEKLAEEEERAKNKRLEQRQVVAKAEAAVREEARKLLHKRCFHVGALAREAGLLAWSDADLAGVFAVLGTLADVPNPAALVAGLLRDERGLPGTPVDGSAEAGPRVRTAF